MATLLGQIAASPIGNYGNPNLDVAYQTQTFLGWPPGVNEAGTAVSGTLTRGTSAPAPANRVGGQIALSYANDFYNRIYFIPAAVDLGAIAHDGKTLLQAWNAYYEQPVVLESIAYPSGLGVAITGEIAAATFAPLETKTYTVQYTADGPVVINGTFDWTFTGLPVYHLRLSGQRATLWPLLPNWKSEPYQVTYRFQTEIITASRTGKEQRRSLRGSPRKQVEYTGLSARRDFQKLKALLWAKQPGTFVMPEMTRGALTQTTLQSNDTVVVVESVPEWLTPGVDIVLRHGKQLAVHSVEQVDMQTRSVTFAGGGEAVFPGGSFIHPALAGHLATNLQVRRQTNMVAEPVVSFDVTPLSEPVEGPGTPEAVYNGRELFMRKPNWSGALDVQSIHPVEDVDYGWGGLSRFVPVAFGGEVRQMTFSNRDRGKATALRKLFLRMQGRRGEFYAPTWEDDIAVQSDFQAAGTVLVSPGTDLANYFGGSTVHKHIVVFPRHGEPLLRAVTKIEESTLDGEPVSSIHVDSAWDVNMPASEVLMVCWLLVWRFASDDLTFQWETNTVSNVQFSLQSLEDLPVETVPA